MFVVDDGMLLKLCIVMICNNMEVLCGVVFVGLGIGYMFDFFVCDVFEYGVFVIVFDDYWIVLG